MECNCVKPCDDCTCCFDGNDIEIDIYVEMKPKKEWTAKAVIKSNKRAIPRILDPEDILIDPTVGTD